MQFDVARYWYRPNLPFLMWLWVPFSLLFNLAVTLRHALYRYGWLKSYALNRPVIIVGNISVGGTGKTPLVIWLAKWLQARGYRPGIISRGVGGQTHAQPCWVQEDSGADQVGDEALLLLRHTRCPVVLCKDRVMAGQALLQHTDCDIVISDDGLQHYRLQRALEIAVVDAVRGLGNGWLLPVGPLRESISRLQSVDMVVTNGGEGEKAMTLISQSCVALTHSSQTVNLADFPYKKVHAVAGIGHPERFFATLKLAGLEIIPHVFPDHYLYRAQDFQFEEALPILMTEKDAVKCGAFADQRFWYVPVTVQMGSAIEAKLQKRLCHEVKHNDY
jgi:tetraacyldisaccharide 4'-kinase